MKKLIIIKNFFSFLLLTLCIAANANAVSIKSGQSYLLTGAFSAADANGNILSYSLTNSPLLSYFTFDGNTALVSVVLNGISANGQQATIKISNNLFLGLGSGPGYDLTLVAGHNGTIYSGGYKDIGDYIPLNNPGLATSFAIAMNGQINSTNNTFKFWGAYFNNITGNKLFNTDFHLTIGRNVTTEVPEPMSMSLLAIGLLGGAINKRKRITA